MLAVEILFVIAGFALLVKGADWFVDGAAGIAKKCGISALIVGLTVVAFGTSAPELAVSVTSAVEHSTDISIGNVVGSNITNILLILGVSALVRVLPVRKTSLVLDIPVLLVSSALLIGLGAWGNSLAWYDGLVFLAVFIGYMAALILLAKRGKTPPAEPEEIAAAKTKAGAWLLRMEQKTWFLIILTLVGLGMVVGGGTLLVDGARYIAEYFGVGEDVIGLTVVAIGTSLPELVTSVVAAAKGETEIAVGNVIGSNIFNILLVAGAASLFYPLSFSLSTNLIDALVALGAALLLYILALAGKKKIGRIAGVIFLLSFIAYYAYLFAVRL